MAGVILQSKINQNEEAWMSCLRGAGWQRKIIQIKSGLSWDFKELKDLVMCITAYRNVHIHTHIMKKGFAKICNIGIMGQEKLVELSKVNTFYCVLTPHENW